MEVWGSADRIEYRSYQLFNKMQIFRMFHTFFLFFLCICACGLEPQSVSEYQQVYRQKISTGQEAAKYVLNNGLQIVLIKDNTDPLITYQTTYRVGSFNEPPNEQGIVHYLEHLLFRISLDDTIDMRRLVRLNGGTNFNAETAKDGVYFQVTLPKDKLEFIAALESKRMASLEIKRAAFEEERRAILNEIVESNHKHFFWNQIYDSIYQDHNYKYPGIGSEDRIKALTLEDVTAFHKAFFKPKNAAVIVVGDIDIDQAVRVITDKYGNIETGEKANEYTFIERGRKQDALLHISHESVDQYTYVRIWQAPTLPSFHVVPLSMLGFLMENYLHQKIAHFYSTHMSINHINHRYDNLFIFQLESVDVIEFDGLNQVIDESLSFLEVNIDSNLLKVAQDDYRQKMYHVFTNQENMVNYLGDTYLTEGDALANIDILDKIDLFKISDIRMVIKRLKSKPTFNAMFAPIKRSLKTDTPR